MDVFEEWCHLLEGAQHEIIVYSNLNLFSSIFDDLKKNLIVDIQNQLRNQHQI
jgi:hypothetical protein